jgi:amino acid transporter
MKYGESTFDILYLLFAIISGIQILSRAGNQTERKMGLAALILGCGDAFHLVPRVLNYFIAADFTAALGIGKLVTSITMTVFYVLMYQIYLGRYELAEKRNTTLAVMVLAAVRVFLCLCPQNGWQTNSGSVLWGVIRNVPFIALGAIICWLYYTRRQADKLFAPVWIYILLSFLFYIPVAVGASIVPMLGMLMLPKTICYILLICVFRKAVLGQK